MTAKTLPSEITSYDLLKAFALVMMIVDHIGMYFLPDQLWWRVAGRTSAPVWLFLIGYARTRDLSPRMAIGGTILTLWHFVTGPAVFPLNILLTMLLIRLSLDKIMVYALSDRFRFFAFVVVFVVAELLASLFFEYGSVAFLLAAYGYMARQYKEGKISYSSLRSFAIFTAIIHGGFQSLYFGFSGIQMQAAVVSCGMVIMSLLFFRPVVYSKITRQLPFFLVAPVQLMGRRTLEVYVLHVFLFAGLAAYLGVEGYGWFAWSWFPN